MKHLKKLWKDILSETPKIYKWIFGSLISISASSASVAFAYSELPTQLQVLPDGVLKIVAGLSLIGALLAKKQNVK